MGRARHVICGLTKKTFILVIVILSSIVQNTFAGEAGEGERGRRSGDD